MLPNLAAVGTLCEIARSLEIMFYYVKGTVAHTAPYLAVIDCGGVGYACRTTNNTLAHLKKGETAKLYTHLNDREDAKEL